MQQIAGEGDIDFNESSFVDEEAIAAEIATLEDSRAKMAREAGLRDAAHKAKDDFIRDL